MSAPAGSDDEFLHSFEDLTEDRDRGLLKKIIRESTCDIKPYQGDQVVVHYVGTYYGGEQHGVLFDSSRDRNEKFEFTIGRGDVIKGWDVGVATMKVGEICELVVSSEYGYKDGKTMKFEIELFDTKGTDVSTDHDGSVRKSVIEKGRDWSKPAVGFEASIAYRQVGSGDYTEITYLVGDPYSKEIPVCVDLAVREMNVAERASVRCHTSFDKRSASDGGTMKVEDAVFEVRLIAFEKVKMLSSFKSFDDQMVYAEELKSRANQYLKDSNYVVAVSIYEKLDEELPYVVPKGFEQQKVLSAVTTAVRLNLALAHLKQGDSGKCASMCGKVLDVDASNEKALFRLGQASLLKRDHEDAALYFKRIVSSSPENSAAVQQLTFCESKIKEAELRKRQLFKGVFNRLKETGLSGDKKADASIFNIQNGAVPCDSTGEQV